MPKWISNYTILKCEIKLLSLIFLLIFWWRSTPDPYHRSYSWVENNVLIDVTWAYNVLVYWFCLDVLGLKYIPHYLLSRPWHGIIVTTALLHYIDVIMTTMASQITSLTVVYSTVYSDAHQRKHQSSASLAFVWGIHRDRWIPRTKGQLRGKCFHLMTSSSNDLWRKLLLCSQPHCALCRVWRIHQPGLCTCGPFY